MIIDCLWILSLMKFLFSSFILTNFNNWLAHFFMINIENIVLSSRSESKLIGLSYGIFFSSVCFNRVKRLKDFNLFSILIRKLIIRNKLIIFRKCRFMIVMIWVHA